MMQIYEFILNYFHIVTVKLCFMPVNEEFKRLIDKIKYEFSINQAQISERLGVKSTYLSDMINGRVPYNESMQKKIHEVFHILWILCSRHVYYSLYLRDRCVT